MTIRHTERRHGTYIHLALRLHNGHTLVVQPTLQGYALYCTNCQRPVLEAYGNGRWRGEYEEQLPLVGTSG